MAGMVHAPHVPHDAHADVQPQGAGDCGLDVGVVLPTRDRVARRFCQSPRRLRTSNAACRLTLTVTKSVLSRPDKTLFVTLNMAPVAQLAAGSGLKRRQVWVRIPPGALSRRCRGPLG